jgi:hypothetical protein
MPAQLSPGLKASVARSRLADHYRRSVRTSRRQRYALHSVGSFDKCPCAAAAGKTRRSVKRCFRKCAAASPGNRPGHTCRYFPDSNANRRNGRKG